MAIDSPVRNESSNIKRIIKRATNLKQLQLATRRTRTLSTNTSSHQLHPKIRKTGRVETRKLNKEIRRKRKSLGS